MQMLVRDPWDPWARARPARAPAWRSSAIDEAIIGTTIGDKRVSGLGGVPVAAEHACFFV